MNEGKAGYMEVEGPTTRAVARQTPRRPSQQFDSMNAQKG